MSTSIDLTLPLEVALYYGVISGSLVLVSVLAGVFVGLQTDRTLDAVERQLTGFADRPKSLHRSASGDKPSTPSSNHIVINGLATSGDVDPVASASVSTPTMKRAKSTLLDVPECNPCRECLPTTWKLKSIIFSPLTHMLDQATDIGTLITFIVIATYERRDKNKYNFQQLDMVQFSALSALALFAYRLYSAYQVYLNVNPSDKFQATLYQLVEVLVFRETYKASRLLVEDVVKRHLNPRIHPTHRMKVLNGLEANLEAIPQSVLQLTFLLTLVQFGSVHSYHHLLSSRTAVLFYGSLSMSLITVVTKITGIDTEIVKEDYRLWTTGQHRCQNVFRRIVRVIEVVHRVLLFSIIWVLFDGYFLFILFCIEVLVCLIANYLNFSELDEYSSQYNLFVSSVVYWFTNIFVVAPDKTWTKVTGIMAVRILESLITAAIILFSGFSSFSRQRTNTNFQSFLILFFIVSALNVVFLCCWQEMVDPDALSLNLNAAAEAGLNKRWDIFVRVWNDSDQNRALNTATIEGKSILDCAREEERLDIIAMVFGSDELVNKQDAAKLQFFKACRYGQLSVAIMLLDSYEYSFVNELDDKGVSPLTAAVEHEHEEIMNMLLGAGADVNLRSHTHESADEHEGGMTPLMHAARFESTHLLKALIEAGANLQAKTDGMTAFMFAVSEGRTDAAAELLRVGGRVVLDVTFTEGWTPLMMACRKGFDQLAKLILEIGGDELLHDKDFSEDTAVIHAIKRRHPKVVEVLADVGGRDIFRLDFKAPFMLAIDTGDTDLIKMVGQKMGQQVLHEVDVEGRTPLMRALDSREFHIDVLLTLLQSSHIEDILAQDSVGRTALLKTMKGAPPRVIEILVEYGKQELFDIVAGNGDSCLITACKFKQRSVLGRIQTLAVESKLINADEQLAEAVEYFNLSHVVKTKQVELVDETAQRYRNKGLVLPKHLTKEHFLREARFAALKEYCGYK